MLALPAGGGLRAAVRPLVGSGRQGRRFLTQCSLCWQAEPALESGYRAEGLRAAVRPLVGWGRQGRRFLTQCLLCWQAELALGLIMGLRAAVGSLGGLPEIDNKTFPSISPEIPWWLSHKEAT